MTKPTHYHPQFDCCGVAKSDDWIAANAELFNATSLPMSCCRSSPGAIGMVTCPDMPDKKTLRQTGCITSFGAFIKSHAVSLGAAGIVLAVIQVGSGNIIGF